MQPCGPERWSATTVPVSNTQATILVMAIAESGRVRWWTIVIQALVLLGLAAFFKFFLPHYRRQSTEREAASREHRINALFENSVETDTRQQVSVPLDGAIVKRYPQRLRLELSPREVEDRLGLPARIATDFRGGRHLTWFGTNHKLEAAFNAGRLYCLTLEDRSTGHGVMVFAAPTSWHPY